MNIAHGRTNAWQETFLRQDTVLEAEVPIRHFNIAHSSCSAKQMWGLDRFIRTQGHTLTGKRLCLDDCFNSGDNLIQRNTLPHQPLHGRSCAFQKLTEYFCALDLNAICSVQRRKRLLFTRNIVDLDTVDL